MSRPPRISIVLPALNEEQALPLVLAEIPKGIAAEIVVVDNGSTDGTAEAARRAGARVVAEPRRGYGRACLSGIAALDRPDIIVFLDADHSDYPEDLPTLLEPILAERADFVVGSRIRGGASREALLPQAYYGNRLACALLRLCFGARHTDLGPFRAIRSEDLYRLQMVDCGYGWTVEMQAKAAMAGLRVEEVPVRYRPRVGRSKITGTVRGTIGAGTKILWTIARLRMSARVGSKLTSSRPRAASKENRRALATAPAP